MPMPVRPLPVVQNWDCAGCSDCCRTYRVRVTEAEKKRLDEHGWASDPAVGGAPTEFDPASGDHHLRHTADGRCVLLGDDNRCRVHAKHGAAAKPMACRIYPFVLVPAGNHWRVGLRYGCPSAARNEGRPLVGHAEELSRYAGLLEADAKGKATKVEPPALERGESLPWADLLRAVAAFDKLLAADGVPVGLKLRRVAALADVARKARFDKLRGDRLAEFFDVVANATAEDVPADAANVPPPGWVGRMLFRQSAAIYVRKDNGPEAGVASRGRLTRLRSAARFALGSGRVPRLHAAIPAARFADAERRRGPLSADADAVLTRYYRVKLNSLQFAGAAHHGWPFWEGLDALLLTFPVTLWLARLLTPASDAAPGASAVRQALRIVDDNFGFHPLLGASRQRWAVRTLRERGELAKLAAWYGG